MATVGDMLQQHSANLVEMTGYVSGSHKRWTGYFHPINNLLVHTRIVEGGSLANYDRACIPLHADDNLRLNTPAVPLQPCRYDLNNEADREHWFHSEIVSPMLGAWYDFPNVRVAFHQRPTGGTPCLEEVDISYTVTRNNQKFVLMIGETKRNLIRSSIWQTGTVSVRSSQTKLSQELRGYAYKYACPQIYCFDGPTLLLLQFRATTRDQMLDPECPVDCWVLPLENTMASFREGLYMLLNQGFRRFQGNELGLPDVRVGQHTITLPSIFQRGTPLGPRGRENQLSTPGRVPAAHRRHERIHHLDVPQRSYSREGDASSLGPDGLRSLSDARSPGRLGRKLDCQVFEGVGTCSCALNGFGISKVPSVACGLCE